VAVEAQKVVQSDPCAFKGVHDTLRMLIFARRVRQMNFARCINDMLFQLMLWSYNSLKRFTTGHGFYQGMTSGHLRAVSSIQACVGR
jgi:hypothetical protein